MTIIYDSDLTLEFCETSEPRVNIYQLQSHTRTLTYVCIKVRHNMKSTIIESI